VTFRLLGYVGGQINETTLATSQAGKMPFHNLSLLFFSFAEIPHSDMPEKNSEARRIPGESRKLIKPCSIIS